MSFAIRHVPCTNCDVYRMMLGSESAGLSTTMFGLRPGVKLVVCRWQEGWLERVEIEPGLGWVFRKSDRDKIQMHVEFLYELILGPRRSISEVNALEDAMLAIEC